MRLRPLPSIWFSLFDPLTIQVEPQAVQPSDQPARGSRSRHSSTVGQVPASGPCCSVSPSQQETAPCLPRSPQGRRPTPCRGRPGTASVGPPSALAPAAARGQFRRRPLGPAPPLPALAAAQAKAVAPIASDGNAPHLGAGTVPGHAPPTPGKSAPAAWHTSAGGVQGLAFLGPPAGLALCSCYGTPSQPSRVGGGSVRDRNRTGPSSVGAPATRPRAAGGPAGHQGDQLEAHEQGIQARALLPGNRRPVLLPDLALVGFPGEQGGQDNQQQQ
jgi:hypothetical protein